MSLLDLKSSPGSTRGTIRNVFELLPFKAQGYFKESADERAASDQACRMAFEILGNPGNESAFMQSARSLLCAKASLDPHDMKFPAAIFEDAASASAEWQPYLLAASVHALHGTRSDGAAVLVQVREALR